MIINMLVFSLERLASKECETFSKVQFSFYNLTWSYWVLFNLNQQGTSLPSGITYWLKLKTIAEWNVHFMPDISSFKIHRREKILWKDLCFFPIWFLFSPLFVFLSLHGRSKDSKTDLYIINQRCRGGSQARQHCFEIRCSAHLF